MKRLSKTLAWLILFALFVFWCVEDCVKTYIVKPFVRWFERTLEEL